MPPESMDVLIVLGAMMLVALIVFFCVLLFRKEGKRRHKHRHRNHRKSYREQFQKTASDIRELIRQHKRRRHRRRHHPTNPTLAQTGGLPPIHEADKPPPPAPQP
jgi:FtsZ-interacting cell division protein ZipA